MPKFTMRLRDVIEAGYDIGLGPDDYALFDAGYYPVLKKRIVDHYTFREIGAETPEQFIFFLNRKMREIMPLYNKRYLSMQIEYDPLASTDYTDILTTTATGTTDETVNATSDNDTEAKSAARNVSSETPQVRLSGDGDYATSAVDVNTDTDSKTTTASDSTSHVGTTGNATNSRHVLGRTGAPSQLMMDYRQALINVDLEILDELEPLFMLLWDNGDGYYPPRFMGGLGYELPWMGAWL